MVMLVVPDADDGGRTLSSSTMPFALKEKGGSKLEDRSKSQGRTKSRSRAKGNMNLCWADEDMEVTRADLETFYQQREPSKLPTITTILEENSAPSVLESLAVRYGALPERQQAALRKGAELDGPSQQNFTLSYFLMKIQCLLGDSAGGVWP